MSMFGRRQFASMATRLEPSNLRALCARDWKVKTLRSAPRNFPDEQRSTTDRSCPRARPNRRDHDRDGLDDRLGHFHHLSGIIAIDRRAGMVAALLGRRRLVDDYRRALLL